MFAIFVDVDGSKQFVKLLRKMFDSPFSNEHIWEVQTASGHIFQTDANNLREVR